MTPTPNQPDKDREYADKAAKLFAIKPKPKGVYRKRKWWGRRRVKK